MTPSDVKATLSFSDGSPSMELPIYKGTIGPEVIDIRKLYAQTGKFTYDPGFLSTASCNSTITYIDGDKGELLYRGYPIEQLATTCDYLETCYLLLNGELPTQSQKEEFTHLVTHHTMINEQMQFFLRGFRRDRIRWRFSRGWSARSRPSITTPPTSTTRSTARSRRSA